MSRPVRTEEKDMFVVTNKLRESAVEIARTMERTGSHRASLPLFPKEKNGHSGIISDSKEGLIVLSMIEVDGKSYFIGLPQE